MAAFLLNAGAASAAQFKVTCCDGTVVYCQGLSLQAYYSYTGSLGDVGEYILHIGNTECKNHGGCATKVEELKQGLSIEERIETNTIPEGQNEGIERVTPTQA